MFLNQFFIVAAFSLVQGKETASEMSRYHRMPPLYDFDEYDYCMMDETSNAPTYCWVNAEILPDPNVLLWQQINDFSNNVKEHFRHDQLVFGKCLNWCMHLADVSLHINNLETANKTQDLNSLTSYTYNFENRPINLIMQKCINETFSKKYGLNVTTNVKYCDSKADYKLLETDVADILFYAVVCVLLILCVASSSYDFWLKKSLPIHLQSNQHYKGPIPKNGNSYLVSFSITRNWYRLSMPSNEKDLRSLDLIKGALLLAAIVCHVFMMQTASPIANPEFIEDFFTDVATAILLNGWVIIQGFFAISGFLLSIRVVNYFNEKQTLSSWTIMVFFFLRYFRYVTVYAVVLLFEASILAKLSDGPFWKHIIYTERNWCRKTWWANFLLVNNYVNPDEPCMLHSWYIATDFQLYIINLIILAIILQKPNRRKLVIGIGLIISVVLPGLTVYFQHLDGVFFITPEILKRLLVQDKGFKDFHKPTHMNFGSYFIGVISGFLFIQYKKEKKTYDKKPGFAFFVYFVNVLAILFWISGYLFYYWDFPKPSLWDAIYGALFRNFWGIYTIILIFGFSYGIGWIFREFTCYPFFRIWGRLTYGAYICHFTIIRTLFGSLRQPIHTSYAFLTVYSTTTVISSYATSLILALMVESPTIALLKA